MFATDINTYPGFLNLQKKPKYMQLECAPLGYTAVKPVGHMLTCIGWIGMYQRAIPQRISKKLE